MPKKGLEVFFFLVRYFSQKLVTSEGAVTVSHNVLYYKQLFIARYYSTIILSNLYQKCQVPLIYCASHEKIVKSMHNLYVHVISWKGRYRRCDLWRHSKTITWFARIPPGKTFVFWQPARKGMQSYHDKASFCPTKHDVYSVLSTEGSLNVNVGHIVYTMSFDYLSAFDLSAFWSCVDTILLMYQEQYSMMRNVCHTLCVWAKVKVPMHLIDLYHAASILVMFLVSNIQWMLLIILKIEGTRLFCSSSLGLVTPISMGEIQCCCSVIKKGPLLNGTWSTSKAKGRELKYKKISY